MSLHINFRQPGTFLATLLVFAALISCTKAWRNPETIDPGYRIHLDDTFEWQKLEPANLYITFDPSKINTNMTLRLMGYSELNATKISKVNTPFTLLASADVPADSKGELDVKKLGLKCRLKEDQCNLYSMGYLEIDGEKTADRALAVSLMSQLIPLGWFIDPLYKKANFPNWPFGKCQTWFSSETAELRAAMSNLTCPPDLSAAKGDPSWMLVANYLAGFPIEEGDRSNSSAQPNQQCFYSDILDVPASQHAAPTSLCCYRNSDSMLLHNSFMSPKQPSLHGSSILRSHPFGSDYHHDHYLPGHVPYLSHWYWDIVPRLHCCHWWDGSACVKLYQKLRPSPPPQKKPSGSKAISIYGSTVFSLNTAYGNTFCSQVGEYSLLESSSIQVHVRYYTVSSYTGPKPVGPKLKNAHFRSTGSRTPFITAIAVRSFEMSNKVVEIVCAEGEFRSFVQVTDLNDKITTVYDGKSGRGIGTKVVVGDSIMEDGNKRFSILVKHSKGRVGIYAYATYPAQQFFNLYVTVSNSIITDPGTTGLIFGDLCSYYKVTDYSNRLFSPTCEFCDDFYKYNNGRPMYFEDLNSPANVPASPEPECPQGDQTCHYMTWSTNYYPYFESSYTAMIKYIDPLMQIMNNTGQEMCPAPNISGLYIGPEQSINETSVLKLKCQAPYKASSDSVLATCKKSGDGEMAFDYPKDFMCAEPEDVREKEKQAAKDDEAYVKEHYALEASTDGSKSGSRLIAGLGLSIGLPFAMAFVCLRPASNS